MKKRNLFISLALLLGLFTTQQVFAQQVDLETGLVVWTGSTVEQALQISTPSDPTDPTDEGGFFFLVEFKERLSTNDKERYVAARGRYGVQAVMSAVGMRLQLVESPEAPTDHPEYERPFKNQFPTAYQVVSRIENADQQTGYLGDRMGADEEGSDGQPIYMDRSEYRTPWGDHYNNFPNWIFNKSTSTKFGVRFKGETEKKDVEVTTYTIQNTDTRQNLWGNNWGYRGTWITINDNGELVTTFDETKATKFVIVSETDFDNAMREVTWGEVDLGVFVQDATFGRDNKDGKYWVWENAETDANGKTLDDISHISDSRPHWHQRNQDVMCNGVKLSERRITQAEIGDNVATNDSYDHNDFRNSFGQYYAAEIYNEVNSLTQTLHGATIPNLVDGLYKFTAQALYHDGNQGKTNLDPDTGKPVAYFLVKRDVWDGNRQNIIETTTEYMPILPMNQLDGNNITAQSGVSAGYVFNHNDDAYLLTTYVEINGNTDLTIGIVQNKAVGWTVIGNVHLYAHGKQAMYVDEDWTPSETISYTIHDEPFEETNVNPYLVARWHDNYDYPSTVYYQRTFTVNKWNPICLPLDLTGRQVRQAFGADAKVCAFIGQDTNLPDGNGCILFQRPLDLDQAENLDETIIQAGVPYIIYVSNQPQYPDGVTAEVGNGAQNHTIVITGPTYAIPGVQKIQSTAYQEQIGGVWQLKEPQVVEPDGTDIKFVGSFYQTKIDKNDIHNELAGKTTGTKDYWVITKGDMYHLTGNKDYTIWATYAYLYMPKSANSSGVSNLTFAIDEDGVVEPTTIADLFIDRGNGIDYGNVYNLSGQKVATGSLEGLPKGIYLLNGKKYVAR